MAEILVAEDDRIAAKAYLALFAEAGYGVRLARNGAEAVAAFDASRPDVVLLDVMMPGGDGFEACRRIRERDEFVPIVFNTALDGVDDMKRALELGGDDYVLKTDPDGVRLARVARALARYEAFAAARRAPSDTVEVGRVTVDFASLTATDRKGRETRLTRTEADILRLLASDRGRVFSCDEIIAAVRGEGFVCDDGLLYVHIRRLRAKLGPSKSLLVNRARVGYQLLD